MKEQSKAILSSAGGLFGPTRIIRVLNVTSKVLIEQTRYPTIRCRPVQLRVGSGLSEPQGSTRTGRTVTARAGPPHRDRGPAAVTGRVTVRVPGRD
jgi:hypothetical protein